MSRCRAARLLSLGTAVCVLAIPQAGRSAVAEPDAQDQEADRRERLTEREDKRRPLEPWGFEVGGHPLTFGGEYEFELDGLQRIAIGDDVDQPDRLLLQQGLEAEAFYSLGQPLSIFVQGRLAMEEDLLPETVDEVSDVYVERGEMWLYSENVLGSHLNVDVGRLDYEDDRRWWWDDELDSLRVAYERDTFEIALAVARELFPERSDRDSVDSERQDVARLIGELSWDWSADHAIELFLLAQDDHSSPEQLGEVVSQKREDDTDSRLLWLGARAIGLRELRGGSSLGYWLDAGFVTGDERVADFEDVSGSQSEVSEVFHQDVRGYGLDAGLSWIFALPLEPRVYGSYALGSGDASPEQGTDHAYRQSGIQDNEAGFGGVERFGSYGVVLDPELSNLGIVTLGAGLTLFESSSLDLVYHHFRQLEAATSPRDARLEAELTGEDRDVGHEVDLALAIEEWERLELFLVAAAFRAGDAFGDKEGTWSYGGFFAVRFAY